MESLAEIRKRRLSLGISLGQLARAVGRSDATMSRIERGQIRPSYELVQRIVSYLEQHEGVASPHLTAADVMNATPVTISANAALAQAAQAMDQGAFSQVPVLDEGRVTGSLSESALLRALGSSTGRRARVRDVQEAAYPQVDPAFPADLLAQLLTRYPAVLVAQQGELVGIVTKTDLIRGLRGTPLRRVGERPVG
jgi:predicted transcriptional regulator